MPEEAFLRAAQVRPALLHRARPSLHTDLRQTAHLRPSQVRMCSMERHRVDAVAYQDPNPDPDSNRIFTHVRKSDF